MAAPRPVAGRPLLLPVADGAADTVVDGLADGDGVVEPVGAADVVGVGVGAAVADGTGPHESSTLRKLILAVLPTLSLRSFSFFPGTSIRMVEPAPVPCRVTLDSATPSPSTRWRMMLTAWSTASSVTVPCSPGGTVGLRVRLVPPARSMPSFGEWLPLTTIQPNSATTIKAMTASARPGRDGGVGAAKLSVLLIVDRGHVPRP